MSKLPWNVDTLANTINGTTPEPVDFRTYSEKKKKGWWLEKRSRVPCILPADGLLAIFRLKDVEAIMNRYAHGHNGTTKIWYFNPSRDREIAELDGDRVYANPQVLLENFLSPFAHHDVGLRLRIEPLVLKMQVEKLPSPELAVIAAEFYKKEGLSFDELSAIWNDTVADIVVTHNITGGVNGAG